MPAQISVTNLPFNALQDSCTWNLHPFLDSIVPDTLEQSIHKVGILHPPVLVQSGETYDVVCGRKRIQCAQNSGQSHFLCGILPQDSSKKTILTFLLEDQVSHAPLSLPEMACFLKLCLDHMDREEALEMLPGEILPRLNTGHVLSLLEFDDDIQRQIHYGHVTDKIIFDLLKLNQADRRRMVFLVGLLQLGGNKQKRLFALCRDISLRENISISSLLDQPDIRAILEHNEMNVPQKTNRLLSQLQKRCYPQSTAARENFQAQVLELNLPDTCDISPSPFFEKDEVTLSLRFSDFEACKKLWPAIKSLLRQEHEGKTNRKFSSDS
jgi:ParB family transcriptional regulator, chromosome partitioning protein